jgi:hypothetical protein
MISGDGDIFQIVDVDPPETAHVLLNMETPFYPMDIAADGRYAYVLLEESGLRLIRLW